MTWSNDVDSAPDNLDTDKLRDEIKAVYPEVATNPHDNFHFQRGPSFVENFLGSDPRDLRNLPIENTASFLEVGNPHRIAPIVAGETVADIGSGAGTELFIVASKVGSTGGATGIDMTDKMIELARRGVEKLGLEHVEIRKGDAENRPIARGSVDVVITNGVLNLTSNKLEAFSEIARFLKPGARLQYSDIIREGVLSESAHRNIDSWIGRIAGAFL